MSPELQMSVASVFQLANVWHCAPTMEEHAARAAKANKSRRLEGEVRPGDSVFIRPHSVKTPSWMPGSGRLHMRSNDSGEVLQVIPSTGMSIVRVDNTYSGSVITAIETSALEVVFKGD